MNIASTSITVTCRKTLRCLHHRLRKISLQDLKRHIAVQTAVRLHSVIEINKAAQLLSPVFRTVKQLFPMPHLHQGADNPFRLTVGLRTGNPDQSRSHNRLHRKHGWPSLYIPYRCRSKRTQSGMGRDQSGVRSETWRHCLRFCPAKWRRIAPLRNRRWRQTGNPAYRWLSAL